MTPAAAVLAGSAALTVYSYAGYPAVLWLLSRRRRTPCPCLSARRWPMIDIVVPAFNEEASIRGALEAIVAADYPVARRRILVLSDASTDRTDEIVREFADHGVQLLRRQHRGGKTANENAAIPMLTSPIIVNTDASVRVHPGALKALVRAFADPTVGVASSRDVSVAAHAGGSVESGYVGYEMRVRQMETAVESIVGASGCLYAIRAEIHRHQVPDELSRDFAAALGAREKGYRAVSVPEAICFVPQTGSVRDEYRRKVRTIARGLNTLSWKRALLNPWRHGVFAWMLVSHKVCRWLVPWAGLVAAGALIVLAAREPLARWGLALAACGAAAGLAGWFWPGVRAPRLLRIAAFAVAGNVAVLHAGVRAAAGHKTPLWSPTRRAASPALSRAEHDGEGAKHDLEVLQH